jgi:hypothetical protein
MEKKIMYIIPKFSIIKSLLLIMLVVNILETKSISTDFKSFAFKNAKDSIGLVTVGNAEEKREERNRLYCDKQFQKCLQQPSPIPDKYDYCRIRMLQRDDCRRFYLDN